MLDVYMLEGRCASSSCVLIGGRILLMLLMWLLTGRLHTSVEHVLQQRCKWASLWVEWTSLDIGVSSATTLSLRSSTKECKRIVGHPIELVRIVYALPTRSQGSAYLAS